MAVQELVTTDNIAFSRLSDLFKSIRDESEVNDIIDSITFDVQSQKIIIKMQKLVKEEAEEVARMHNETEDLAEEKIRELSRCYSERYPELLEHFKEWFPVRKKLVHILKRSSENLERNSSLVSCFRILASTADIFGTMTRTGGESHSSWADFAMEHSSTLGLLSLFIEMTMSKKMHRDVRKAIKKDQEIFNKIVTWFKQTEELDAAIKSFFPYGIDVEVVQKINECTSDFDEYNKIFTSIVASNAKKNAKLFKDKKFLGQADRIASSEAGKQWFHKVILQNDPVFNHCLNSNLNEEIQDILKICPAENKELYVDACRVLSSKVKMKVTLNVMTIISAGSNLLFGSKPEESEVLKEFSDKTHKEQEEMQKVVRFLKPSGSVLDPVLT